MDAAGAVEHIREGVAYLAALDLDTLCNAELDEFLVELVHQQSPLDAAIAHLAARWDANLCWATRGRSAAAVLAREAGCARRTSNRHLRRGRALREMPNTDEAYSAGELSSDHVDLLSTCTARSRREQFRDYEETLVNDAKPLRYDQAAKFVAYWKQHADAAAGDDGDEPDDGYEANVGRGVNDEVTVGGTLDPVGGAEFETALNHIADELAAADKATGGRCTRSKKQLRAAALVEMARRAMAMPADARKPRPLVTVVCGQAEFERLCELSNGVVISPRDLVPHLDAIDIETMLFDRNMTAISKSPSRTFTGALRRAIEVRDRHCQHEHGCDEPIDRCDVDHVVARCHGGATSQANGRLLCRYHNRIHPQLTRPPALRRDDRDDGERDGDHPHHDERPRPRA